MSFHKDLVQARHSYNKMSADEKIALRQRVVNLYEKGQALILAGENSVPEKLASLLSADWMDLVIMSGCWLSERWDKHRQKEAYERAWREAVPTEHEFLHYNNVLYAVTTIAKTESLGGCRILAICNNLEDAREIVEKNAGDIWEHSYMFAVIQTITANHLYSTHEAYWYRWNLDEQRYEAIKEPEQVVSNLFPIG